MVCLAAVSAEFHIFIARFGEGVYVSLLELRKCQKIKTRRYEQGFLCDTRGRSRTAFVAGKQRKDAKAVS